MRLFVEQQAHGLKAFAISISIDRKEQYMFKGPRYICANKEKPIVTREDKKYTNTATNIHGFTAADEVYGAQLFVDIRNDTVHGIFITIYDSGYFNCVYPYLPQRSSYIRLENRDHLVRLHELIGKVLDEWPEKESNDGRQS